MQDLVLSQNMEMYKERMKWNKFLDQSNLHQELKLLRNLGQGEVSEILEIAGRLSPDDCVHTRTAHLEAYNFRSLVICWVVHGRVVRAVG